jgi:hypothetical protein
MPFITCTRCQLEREAKPTPNGKPRTPNGWKKTTDQVLCPTCLRDCFGLRVVVLPLSGPVGCTWDELREKLDRSWAQSTGLANWVTTELAKADVVRLPDAEQLESFPPVELYHAARQRFPGMPSKSVATVIHTAQGRYLKNRLAVVWRSEASLQRFRYPVAFPVNNQGWSAYFGKAGEPLVDLNLDGERVILRLQSGIRFRRQLAAFSKLANGAAIKGEFSIYRQRASASDHRACTEDRKPGGGNRVLYRVMVKMSGWWPKAQPLSAKKGILKVRTAAESFLVATAENRLPWVLNADHIRKWAALHRRRIDRLAQDRKHEKRWPKRMRNGMASFADTIVEKHRRRMNTFCHQASASLAAYAKRLGVEEVHFDSKDRSYVAEFPYFRFQEMLGQKLEQWGIRLTREGSASDTADEERNLAA